MFLCSNIEKTNRQENILFTKHQLSMSVHQRYFCTLVAPSLRNPSQKTRFSGTNRRKLARTPQELGNNVEAEPDIK